MKQNKIYWMLAIICFLTGIAFCVSISYIFDIRINKPIKETIYYNHMKKWVIVSTEPSYNSDYMDLKLERTFNGEIQEKEITVLINKLHHQSGSVKFYDTSLKYQIGDTINIP